MWHNALSDMQHVVKYLKRGIWPEQLNREGDAPIHYYVKRRDKYRFDCLMAFLIHSQSVVDLVNNDGMTALHLACEVREEYNFVLYVLCFIVHVYNQWFCVCVYNEFVQF